MIDLFYYLTSEQGSIEAMIIFGVIIGALIVSYFVNQVRADRQRQIEEELERHRLAELAEKRKAASHRLDASNVALQRQLELAKLATLHLGEAVHPAGARNTSAKPARRVHRDDERRRSEANQHNDTHVYPDSLTWASTGRSSDSDSSCSSSSSDSGGGSSDSGSCGGGD